MKAISLWQPWASLIASGDKRIETRSWRTHYRGRLAIHAAKRRMDSAGCDLGIYYLGMEATRALPFGAVVAFGELWLCVPVEQVHVYAEFDGRQHSLGNYSSGRWAWILKNVEAVDPMPARGRQGLWNLQ